jgi:D-alanine transfer protein
MFRPRLLSGLPRHLRAFLLAAFCAASLLALGVGGAMFLERRYLRAVAPETSQLKNQGVVLQRAAFSAQDVLPLYGSSELLKHVPDKASEFYARHAADFVVSPAGRAGSTSLILLQKIAASAGEVRGHKVAIILSPSWFLVPEPHRRGYEGNFSLSQASSLVFSSSLSPALKRDVALRLLEYPQTLEKAPLLKFAVQHLATNRFTDRLLFKAAVPMGRLENTIFAIQEHCLAGLRILQKQRRNLLAPPALHEPEPLPWSRLLVAAARKVKTDVDTKRDPRPRFFANDADFLSTLEGAREWQDLELLLRTLQELHCDPLLITIPIERRHFEEMGLSTASIDAYDHRLLALAARYRMPLADFADHGDDGKFFADHHDHLSAKGWMYLDKALDDFYHAPHRHLHPRYDHSGRVRS